MQRKFSNHNGIKLEVNNMRKFEKYTKLNRTTLKDTFSEWKQKHRIPRCMEYTESRTQKCIAINGNVTKEKDLKLNLAFHFMKLAKEQQTKPKARKRKGIINIKVEINEREN